MLNKELKLKFEVSSFVLNLNAKIVLSVEWVENEEKVPIKVYCWIVHAWIICEVASCNLLNDITMPPTRHNVSLPLWLVNQQIYVKDKSKSFDKHFEYHYDIIEPSNRSSYWKSIRDSIACDIVSMVVSTSIDTHILLAPER